MYTGCCVNYTIYSIGKDKTFSLDIVPILKIW